MKNHYTHYLMCYKYSDGSLYYTVDSYTQYDNIAYIVQHSDCLIAMSAMPTYKEARRQADILNEEQRDIRKGKNNG